MELTYTLNAEEIKVVEPFLRIAAQHMAGISCGCDVFRDRIIQQVVPALDLADTLRGMLKGFKEE